MKFVFHILNIICKYTVNETQSYHNWLMNQDKGNIGLGIFIDLFLIYICSIHRRSATNNYCRGILTSQDYCEVDD